VSKRNTAASVRARLLVKARTDKQDFNLVLTRYALERLLYRLSVSAHADHFLLKGALLFDLCFDIPHRPTRDADLLGFGSTEIPHVEAAFREICAVELDDGIRFQADSVHSEEILSLRRTYSGLTGTSQTYTLANDEADSGLGRPNALLRIELEANRSGVTSLQKHSVSFERAGYGLHYDKYYGESPRVS